MARKHTFAPALTLLLSLCLPGACADDPAARQNGLHLQQAYIKAPVPGRSMTAAYATFINRDSQPMCLVGFEAEFARAIELHSTERAGGPNSQRTVMRHLPRLCLASGERVALEPGGKHLMAMGVDALPEAAATLRIGTAEGRLFEASFEVQPFNYVPGQ